ncbi:alpha/beta hydrolase [Pedobacter cryophilus]|uniref:Alpha/beta hydrolase n=1 Tax=Pedobacter cryophilus TaxID=2571271 RepID=A0A4U1BWA6_9SPHI|nr:alpha/beta hydrolase [Pedobacter cryophilus]TKB96878.1 alpha/beta hydrolase [Pedobacter cryophilus]
MCSIIKERKPLVLISHKKILFLFISTLLLSINSFAQDYTKEVVKLWDKNNIPFNKKNITLKEIVDSTGRRISQISEPVLYVYRKKNTNSVGAAIMYCPGGGYTNVSLANDGEGFAANFLKMGFDVVAVLKYRLPDPRIVNEQENIPLCDAQKALSLLHQNAKKWQINRNKIAISGGSAGGHLAASLANLKDKIVAPGVKSNELKQAVSILMYPVVTFNLPHRHEGSYNKLLGDKSNDQTLIDYYSMENKVSKKTPPTFVVHAKDDQTVTYLNSRIYIDSLNKYQIKNKYVELDKGGHGFVFDFKKTGVDWTIELAQWLQNETDLFK